MYETNALSQTYQNISKHILGPVFRVLTRPDWGRYAERPCPAFQTKYSVHFKDLTTGTGAYFQQT